MRIQRFEDVIAWQKAKELTKELYLLFGNSNNFVLRDQIFRASLSITNNIAEGFDRASDKELKQFLVIARGSAAEVRSMILITSELGLIPDLKKEQLLNLNQEISKTLTGFIKSITSDR